MSRDLYSSSSTMLRATVLLCLVANAVLTQSLPTAQYNGPTDDTIVDYDSRGSINDTLSAVPKCAADYAKISVANRKMIQKDSPMAHAVCVRADGCFVAAVHQVQLGSPFIFMFDTCGWIKKRILLPRNTGAGSGCVFTSTKLYYAVSNDMKILQFTSDGEYEKVFATGDNFYRLTTQDNSLLYSTIYPTNEVRAYDIATGNLKYRFKTTTGDARGLAFDPSGYLHVSTMGKVVEQFTYKGVKIGQKSYPEVNEADGILIDSHHHILIANRYSGEVFVYTHAGLLTKRITGFNDPADVAMGYQCSYLLVADFRNGVYLL